MAELTPMKMQYQQIKSQYSDCLLFFRLGDFYEMFDEDARVASRELDLALTTRDRSSSARGRHLEAPFCSYGYVYCGCPVRNIGINHIVSHPGNLFYISAKLCLRPCRKQACPFRLPRFLPHLPVVLTQYVYRQLFTINYSSFIIHWGGHGPSLLPSPA